MMNAAVFNRDLQYPSLVLHEFAFCVFSQFWVNGIKYHSSPNFWNVRWFSRGFPDPKRIFDGNSVTWRHWIYILPIFFFHFGVSSLSQETSLSWNLTVTTLDLVYTNYISVANLKFILFQESNLALPCDILPPLGMIYIRFDVSH